MAENGALLRMVNITKTFPGVRALSEVVFEVLPGEIHALVGENGAGKSTLMRVLTGAHPPDSGETYWRGERVEIHAPADAQALGISMIHQELALIPYLDVGKNIYLGREPEGRVPGFIDYPRLYADATAQLARVGLDIDPRTLVSELPIAQRQMVEVAKALSLDASLIVMDEPTSALTDREVETLFARMRELRAQGVSTVFISHRLEEVFRIADRVTVLRDGQLVGTAPVHDLTEERVVRMMVGRELKDIQVKTSTPQGAEILRIEGLRRGKAVRDVKLTLHRGEILGIAGLVGAGRTELAETIFGVHPADAGRMWIDGREVSIRSPAQAIASGIGFVPEDRKAQGLFLRQAVVHNVVMLILKALARMGFLHNRDARATAAALVERLDIRTPSLDQIVRNLSGGNQQKVIIARWLTREPKIMILDEPTRGIDVGAKAEIHRLMSELADRGVGILMISSELPEVLGVSDRVLVMREGQIVAELDPRAATQDDVMRAAAGGTIDSRNNRQDN